MDKKTLKKLERGKKILGEIDLIKRKLKALKKATSVEIISGADGYFPAIYIKDKNFLSTAIQVSRDENNLRIKELEKEFEEL